MDAIGHKNGKITLKSKSTNHDNQVFIDFIDNGKGIAQKEKKNIFKPGFSTKKRGWGLGLSLIFCHPCGPQSGRSGQ